MYNKHSVGNFGPFVSIADRAEALPEHAKRVSWPEPCLIGGGTKGPENCRECVYTWRGSFGPFEIKSQFFYDQIEKTAAVQQPFKKNKKRETGFEPAAPTLARWCSTPEPLAHFKKIFNFDTYLQNHILNC